MGIMQAVQMRQPMSPMMPPPVQGGLPVPDWISGAAQPAAPAQPGAPGQPAAGGAPPAEGSKGLMGSIAKMLGGGGGAGGAGGMGATGQIDPQQLMMMAQMMGY